jgi:hypothetical protein
MNYKEVRPWGSFTILEETDFYKVKRIVVKPGQRLSYQYHFKRVENWVVVAGQAKITINEKKKLTKGVNLCSSQKKHVTALLTMVQKTLFLLRCKQGAILEKTISCASKTITKDLDYVKKGLKNIHCRSSWHGGFCSMAQV